MLPLPCFCQLRTRSLIRKWILCMDCIVSCCIVLYFFIVSRLMPVITYFEYSHIRYI